MKKIVKLLLKCILVSAPMWGMMIFLWQEREYYSNEDFGYTWWNQEFTQTTHQKYYRYLVLGDSSCNAAYMPEVISDSMVNLSIGGASTVEEYYVLEDYLANNEAPTDVFLSYHDSHFKYTEAYWDKIVPSHRFNMLQNLEILYNVAKYKDDSFSREGMLAEYLAAEFYFPSKYITALNNSIGENRFAKLELAYDKIELHGGRYTTLGKTEFETVQDRVYSEMPVKPLYNYYFTKTIELCVENNIAVHIVKPPLPDNTEMTAEYVEQVFYYYKYFVDSYPNVTFSWNTKIMDRKLFADEIHMNNDGALAFSTILKNEFKDIFPETRYTADMMLAVDDSIQQENIAGYLMHFIGDRDYTVLMYDGGNCVRQFRKQFTAPVGLRSYSMKEIDENAPNADNLYVLLAPDNEAIDFTIEDDGTSLVVKNDKLGDNRWALPNTTCISLFIIDNVNEQLVGIKNIQYNTTDKTFSNYVF